MLGMSGAGKTTVGKWLAQQLNYTFVDTDTIIENKIGTSIQTYIDQHGDAQTLKMEEEVLLSIALSENTIVSPGGSIIYSKEVMEKFKRVSFVIYLYDTSERIKERIPDLQTRGIIGSQTKTFDEIFQEREPLYEAYSDMIINCGQFETFEDIGQFITEQLNLLCLSEV